MDDYSRLDGDGRATAGACLPAINQATSHSAGKLRAVPIGAACRIGHLGTYQVKRLTCIDPTQTLVDLECSTWHQKSEIT
jgi:hypothetical protein